MGGEVSKRKKSSKEIEKLPRNPLTSGSKGGGLKKSKCNEKTDDILSARIQKPPTTDNKQVGRPCDANWNEPGCRPKGGTNYQDQTCGNRDPRPNMYPSTRDINGSNAADRWSRYAPSAPVMDFDTLVDETVKWTVDEATDLNSNVNGVQYAVDPSNPPQTGSKANRVEHTGTRRQTDFAPHEVAESSTLNRRPRRLLRKSLNVEENGDEPPKYEDVVKADQNRGETKKKNGSSSDSTPCTKGDIPKKPSDINISVDALNDLIRKTFGSVGAATHSLGHVDMTDKPFPGRNRLFIRNIPPNIERTDLEVLMSPYSEITVDFIDKVKRQCCVRLKHGSETAQRELDKTVFKGRHIRVQFDNRGVRFKVLNISPWVTNELLKKAFSIFGEVERAEVSVDEDGVPTGEGYLEFAHPKSGEFAFEACKQGCFALTSSLRPVILEKMTSQAGTRIHSEARVPRNNANFQKERKVGPRFVAEGSAEFQCAMLWKELAEKKRRHREELSRKFEVEKTKIRGQIGAVMRAKKTR